MPGHTGPSGSPPCPHRLGTDAAAGPAGGDTQPCLLCRHCRGGRCRITGCPWYRLLLGCWTPMSLGPKEHAGSRRRALAPAFLCGGEGLRAAAGGKAADKRKHPYVQPCGHAASPPEHERSNTSISCRHPGVAVTPRQWGGSAPGKALPRGEVKGSSVVSHGQDGGTSISARR